MDTDIDWLFEEVYKHQREIPEEKLYFLSDWDCEVEDHEDFNRLLKEAHEKSLSNSFKYSFAYEQFDLKAQILELCSNSYTLSIQESSLTITPSATQAIYLSFQALKRLNVNRYLVLTPAYFSTLESLRHNNSFIYYYHLSDASNFSIDYDKLEDLIKEQNIECLVVTDPVFSAGLELSETDYSRLTSIVIKHDIYVFVDYCLGGLRWDMNKLFVLNHLKLQELIKTDKFVFIDSLSKRLQLNGIKFSLVFASSEIIDGIDTISESIYGGLNGLQAEVIRQLYKPGNSQTVITMHEKQLDKIKANYRLIKAMVTDEPFLIADSNSGFFTIIESTDKTFRELDTKKITLRLLKEEHIIMIPNNRFSYYADNKFGWRINLAKNQDELLRALSKCIRKILYCFHN